MEDVGRAVAFAMGVALTEGDSVWPAETLGSSALGVAVGSESEFGSGRLISMGLDDCDPPGVQALSKNMNTSATARINIRKRFISDISTFHLNRLPHSESMEHLLKKLYPIA